MRKREGWGRCVSGVRGSGRGPAHLGGCEVFGETVLEMVNLGRF